MRNLDIPGLMWREPWRLRLADDISDSLERMSSIPKHMMDTNSRLFVDRGSELLRNLETNNNSREVMSKSLEWLASEAAVDGAQARLDRLQSELDGGQGEIPTAFAELIETLEQVLSGEAIGPVRTAREPQAHDAAGDPGEPRPSTDHPGSPAPAEPQTPPTEADDATVRL